MPLGTIKRRAGVLGLLLLLVLFCHCAEDPVSPPEGAQLRANLMLADQTAEPTAIDTIEVAVQQAGELWAARFLAADTLFADSARAIGANLEFTDAGTCSLLAFAYRRTASLAGDTTHLAVAFMGLNDSVTVYENAVATSYLGLKRVDPEITLIEGTVGFPEITIHWDPVAHATTYDLGWAVVDTDSAGTVSALTGTEYALDWSPQARQAFAPTEQDSVLFSIRPYFGARAGIWSAPIGVRPAAWMDLPHLTSISPGHGALVEFDTLTVKIGFDRSMDLQTLYDGIAWRQSNGAAIPFTATALFAGELTHFKLTAETGTLARSQTYRVTISSAVKDQAGLPFDAHTTLPGVQSALVEWHTIAYAPLRILFTDPLPNATDLTITPTLRMIMNRAVDLATYSDTSCYVTRAGGVHLPGIHTASPSGDTLAWQPAAPLEYATAHTLHLTPWLRDQIARRFDGDIFTEPPELEVYSFAFTTRAAPIPPSVEIIEPAPGATGVAHDANVLVFFNKPIDANTVVVGETFKLLRAGTELIAGTLVHDEEQRLFTFSADSLLDQATAYRVEIFGVFDLEGTVFDQNAATPGYQAFTSDFLTTTAAPERAARPLGRKSLRPNLPHQGPRPSSP